MSGRLTAPGEKISVTANDLFWRMLHSAHNQGKGDKRTIEQYVLIGIDPGETTGFAYRLPWEEGFKVHLAQLDTKDIISGFETLKASWPQTSWDSIVVIEDYKVYGWKADDHKWASLHTPQFIGATRILAHQTPNCTTKFQMAAEAKRWADDDKLKSWGLYEAGLRHSRDALRHIVTYAFFGSV